MRVTYRVRCLSLALLRLRRKRHSDHVILFYQQLWWRCLFISLLCLCIFIGFAFMSMSVTSFMGNTNGCPMNVAQFLVLVLIYNLYSLLFSRALFDTSADQVKLKDFRMEWIFHWISFSMDSSFHGFPYGTGSW